MAPPRRRAGKGAEQVDYYSIGNAISRIKHSRIQASKASQSINAMQFKSINTSEQRQMQRQGNLQRSAQHAISRVLE